MLATSLAACGVGNTSPQDQGTKPWVVNIEELTTSNQNFRTTWWTGKQLQMTVMSIQPGEDIGLEVHQKGDQFIRVEEGTARVQMGTSKTNLSFDKTVGDDWAMFIPEGYWHNISNAGNEELKVYVLYAPPEHPAGTIHPTKASESSQP
ncbi:MAG: cupin domain-containing protein [Synechococcus sp.]